MTVSEQTEKTSTFAAIQSSIGYSDEKEYSTSNPYNDPSSFVSSTAQMMQMSSHMSSSELLESVRNPSAVVMDERSAVTATEKNNSKIPSTRLKLKTYPNPFKLVIKSSHPDEGLAKESDCCCPIPPYCGPWGLCVCSKLEVTKHHGKTLEVLYDEEQGRLTRTDGILCCSGQSLSINTFGQAKVGQEVNSFRCGCCTFWSLEKEQFDLLQDGTIAVRGNDKLVLGTNEGGKKVMTVSNVDSHRFVFTQLMSRN